MPLGLERVGMEENFFAIRRRLDTECADHWAGAGARAGVSVQDLFWSTQTVGALARVRGERGWDKEKGTAAFELVGEEVRSRLAEDVEDAYPLSRLQAGDVVFTATMRRRAGCNH